MRTHTRLTRFAFSSLNLEALEDLHMDLRDTMEHMGTMQQQGLTGITPSGPADRRRFERGRPSETFGRQQSLDELGKLTLSMVTSGSVW